jgi:7-cyano-7-deazaguanine synthase
MKEAIVLLSGGLDSTTALYIALDGNYRCHCLIFDYNQRHKKEISQAKKIAKKARCDYKIVRLSFPWQGSALLDKKAKLPTGRNIEDITRNIPTTYVPLRNTIFISIAAGWAEAIGAEVIFIGANAIDFSGYPDCRPTYFQLYNNLLQEGTKSGIEGHPIRIEAPLVDKKKSEIIKIGTRLMVPYELTWSCYKGGSNPCFTCDSCLLRRKGFDEAGLKDPLTETCYEK